jgi:hypothetical protein
LKLRWCRSTQRLHSPVKHCGLSSRRSRVQIPAGASHLFRHVKILTSSAITTNKKLQDLEKDNRNYVSSCSAVHQSNQCKSAKPFADTLPNSVRSPSSPKEQQQSTWTDFKNYLVNEGQRQHSVRNKVGYARRFHYILESKDARDLLKLSHGSKVHTMKALASLSKFLGGMTSGWT